MIFRILLSIFFEYFYLSSFPCVYPFVVCPIIHPSSNSCIHPYFHQILPLTNHSSVHLSLYQFSHSLLTFAHSSFSPLIHLSTNPTFHPQPISIHVFIYVSIRVSIAQSIHPISSHLINSVCSVMHISQNVKRFRQLSCIMSVQCRFVA